MIDVHARSNDVSFATEAVNSADAQDLIAALDDDLRRRYPGHPVHGLHSRDLEDLDTIFVVAREGGRAVACGAIRMLEPGVGEVKRMYVHPEFRRRGLAGRVLAALEHQASTRGVNHLMLETGMKQPEALALYQSAGYQEIAPFGEFGEYIGNPNSRCFEKRLTRASSHRQA